MKKTLLVLFPLVLLAACAPEERLPMAPITFVNEPPITLSVGNIDVVDEYVPPEKLPNVEHAAPVPPYKAIREWAAERLKPTGGTGYLRIGIKDASIVEKKLIGQLEYDGRLDVTFDAASGDNSHTGTAEVVVTRQVIVDSDKDLAQKEKIWNDMTQGMMTEFDHNATEIIRQNLSEFTAQ
jgi:hypothetical protein